MYKLDVNKKLSLVFLVMLSGYLYSYIHMNFIALITLVYTVNNSNLIN